jgi:hypothetical protein
MKLFNLNDTAVILIDHQVGTNTWASSSPPISFESRQVHLSEGGINCLICWCRKSAEML